MKAETAVELANPVDDREITSLDESARWVAWLQAHVDPNWRKGQWDGETWVFTGIPGDPTTTVKRCAVAACDFVIAHGRVCGSCLNAFRKSSMVYEDFIATHRPQRRKERAHELGKGHRQCSATAGGERCPRDIYYRGICLYHYNVFSSERRQNQTLTLSSWLAAEQYKIPNAESRQSCIVIGCDRVSTSRKPGLCHLHYGRYKDSKSTEKPEVWAHDQAPSVIDNQFTLVHVNERLRWELLYAIQKRDASGGRLDIHAVRSVIRFLRKEPSLATSSDADVEQLLARTPASANVRSHLVDYFRSLRNGYDEMLGRRAQDRIVWDFVDVGLSPEPIYRGARKRKGLDFGEIVQPWLRKLLMEWAGDQTDASAVRTCFRVTRIASVGLSQCSGRGDVPSELTASDATSVAEAIREANAPRGKRGSARYRRGLYRCFFDLIDYGRRRRIADIAAEFVPDRQHLIPLAEPVEEESCGKAIPTYVQRQLDANIGEIGRGVQHGGLSSDLVHLLFRTAYVILRDTGRRPSEVVSLKWNCIRRDASGAPILVYDNHKAGRMNRQLPIVRSTAEAVEEWKRAFAPASANPDGYLFPGALPRHNHLLTYQLSTVMRWWVDKLDRLDTNECDKHGSPLPFDRKLIYPYVFRHSYAQRYADNGVAIDVLRDLLDHRSIQTTAGYYTITADRKREAVEIVGKYSTDRTGSPAPFTENTQYQISSVAVPFGNCIEPANVKAGGHACAIRFQCAGCGFYRPDPSYIPAMEEHLNSLRADRETAQALDSAPFVIDNLTAQIMAFQRVMTTMRNNLDQLDPEERNRVEDAAATLRKARAGAALPLTVVRQAELKKNHDSRT